MQSPKVLTKFSGSWIGDLKVFKQYVAYFIWADTIWVVAIAHGHQRPEFWLERKKQIG
jgi:hypothetical protein